MTKETKDIKQTRIVKLVMYNYSKTEIISVVSDFAIGVQDIHFEL